MNIFNELFNVFRDLLFGNSHPVEKFLKVILAIGLFIGGIIIFDSLAGIVTLGRLERQVNLLKELNALTETGLGNQDGLESLYNQTVSGLKQYNSSLQSALLKLFPANSLFEKQTIAEKTIPAIVVWALFSIGVAKKMDDEHTREVKIMAFIFSIFAGFGLGFIANVLIDTQSTVLNVILSLCLGISPFILLTIIEYRFNLFREGGEGQVMDKQNLSREEVADQIIESVGINEIRKEIARSNWEIIESGSGVIPAEQAAKNISKALGAPGDRLSDTKIVKMFKESFVDVIKRKYGDNPPWQSQKTN